MAFCSRARTRGHLRAVTLAAGVLVVATVGVRGESGDVDGVLAGAMPGPVPARVVRVIDGDTLVVLARIWVDQVVETRVRVAGVDAPERRGRCARERSLALQAKTLVETLVGNREVRLEQVRYGKYAGRVVARVRTPAGDDLGQRLVEAGLGHVYDGRTRAPWCP